ncbi:MAG: hexokinase, partial [Treponema sp.]|nr:hexokinase [Treponema sp.]
FARYYRFHYDGINPRIIIKEILIEMERGLKGKSSSLPMIPSYITPVTFIPPGKTVLALDAGGTNLRSSLVSFNENGQAIAHGTKKTFMPGTKGQVTSEQFFDLIADAALPLFKDANVEGIGFTFSYPAEITSDAEGICLAFCKECDAPQVIGKHLGANLREALNRKGCKYNGPIVLLNDTTATLLSGLAVIPPEGVPGPVIGFILGTGLNTAYPESFIPKIGYNNLESPQIVVCESGGANISNLGQLDREFDNTTKNTGSHILEKTVSGAYLGPLTLHILKQAVKDKVLCFAKSDELLVMPHLETIALNEFLCAPLAAQGPLGSLFASSEGDAVAALQYIASIIAERGAFFSAAVLAATIQKTNADLKPYSPVRIAVEGTTYMLFKGMRRSIESHLHQMMIGDIPRSYVISPVEQASLFGAAVAALSKM